MSQTKTKSRKMVTKKVTIKLNTVVIPVTVDESMSDKEVMEEAKKQLPLLISEKFPGCEYSVSTEEALVLNECIPGMVVKSKSNALGILLKVNKTTVHVVYPGCRVVSGVPELFEKTHDEDIDKLLWKRRDAYIKINFWDVGDVGYVVNGSEIYPVIITKKYGIKMDLHLINDPKGRHFKGMAEERVKATMFDERAQAEAFMKSQNKIMKR